MSSDPGKRRSLRRALAVLGATAAGIGVGFQVSTADERITAYAATAVVNDDGSARITERYAYDFSANSRRGIFREIPGLPPSSEADVSVTSPSMPTDLLVTDGRIRIGNPAIRGMGEHDYTLSYTLPRLSGNWQDEQSLVTWNGVGTAIDVPFGPAVVRLDVGREIITTECFIGRFGSVDTCEATEIAPGVVEAKVSSLQVREGVTIDAQVGEALTERPATDIAGLPSSISIPWWVDLIVALAAAIVGCEVVRRRFVLAGRDHVAGLDPVDAAFAGPTPPAFIDQDDPTQTQLADLSQMIDMAGIEFVPPRDLSPVQGGLLLSEQPHTDHALAYLLEHAVAGSIDIVSIGGEEELRITDPAKVAAAPPLQKLFGTRETVNLDKYSSTFARAWNQLPGIFDDWIEASGYWTETRGLDHPKALLEWLIGVVGFVAVVLAAGLDQPVVRLATLGLGAFFLGRFIGMLAHAWELRRRSPLGSSLWLKTESFRRFMEYSEAEHVEWAAKAGRLREYTAWAVAFGLADHWNSIAKKAALTAEHRNDLALIDTSSRLGSAISTASTPPSSSGSGGGGGGFSGGGGSSGGGFGGGGGGSW